MPVMIDAGIYESEGNTAHIDIIHDDDYSGLKQGRVTHKSDAGTVVNSAYYEDTKGAFKMNMIDEFMAAAVKVFGEHVILQFEDFNSNDAFPLLARQRTKFVAYNDDIQGTASIAVAGILGALKIKNPTEKNLIGLLPQESILLHGAGSANIGAAQLMHYEGKVPKSHIFMTNSRGLIWADEAGQGTFRNQEQKEFAQSGEPEFKHEKLEDIVANTHPSCLVGAVGVAPGCFTKDVIEKLIEVNNDGGEGDGQEVHRPVCFALSNPISQAEITSTDAYTWSKGTVIYGSGTKMPMVEVKGVEHHPGQVNNVYIFPGMSFAVVQCQATSIPDRLFLVAAEAVANSLSSEDLQQDRVLPPLARIREVSLNVATAVVLECQKLGLASKTVGETEEAVRTALAAAMWKPEL